MMKNLDHLGVFGMEFYVYIPKQFREEIRQECVWLNDKDGYQVYLPSVKKTVHLHDVFFKPE